MSLKMSDLPCCSLDSAEFPESFIKALPLLKKELSAVRLDDSWIINLFDISAIEDTQPEAHKILTVQQGAYEYAFIAL